LLTFEKLKDQTYYYTFIGTNIRFGFILHRNPRQGAATSVTLNE